MLENIPTQSTMVELLGQSLFEVWQRLCSAIEEKYDMQRPGNAESRFENFFTKLCGTFCFFC